MHLSNTVTLILWWVVILAATWFLYMRPASQQRRKQQEMLKSLKRGDRVVTQGGIHGVIAEVKGDVLELRIAPKLDITVDRSSIQRVVRLENKETEQAKSENSR
jgi:preprotein translocase subunit YajC